ncbi:DUF4178 domain-containing protein [Solirubrum puertoriconensis]|uniref:DUF4178 domain-containing protein n=1 Tax=Solirubrum puertoriconensis TaxID=1751427 RepID=A0A9X0HM38_SOLP1|nr:DUF4178 domain-containing protein [Solirubrum puertoriconensis]KUG08533.1 hypothetical protein ASU33_10265 [Solirubrum puertoriconensis]
MSETATPSVPTAQLECPQCHTTIAYYDTENSTHYGCPACHTYFEYEDPKPPRVIGEFKASTQQPKQVIPLGASGVMLDGSTYVVAGYSVRCELNAQQYRWGEYTLFSAPDKYAQLAVYEGHWTFIQPTERLYKVQFPNSRSAYIASGDLDYRLYNKYQPKVLYAVGEYDYDVFDDEKLFVAEYISPPHMLVEEKERFGKKQQWYRAEHIEPKAVAKAFGVPSHEMPWRSGTGAVQPAPGEDTWLPLLRFTLFMCMLTVVAQFFMSATNPSNLLVNENFSTQPDTARGSTAGPSANIVTHSFEVHGPTAIAVDINAYVDNAWLELPVTLVNEKTGQSYEFTKSIEYYHGYEGGESWSEGSTSADAVLAEVPSGRYHINIYPASQGGMPTTFSLRVTENATLQSNLFLLLGALFVYPAILFLRRRFHEQQRWENSDYGPQGA